MKKQLLLLSTGIIIFNIVFIIGCTSEADLEEAKIPTSVQDRAIFETLVSYGLEKTVVQVDVDKVIIRYDQPELQSDLDIGFTMNFALATAAVVCPDTSKIYLQVFSDNNPLFEVVANTTDAASFAEGRIDYKELTRRLQFNLLFETEGYDEEEIEEDIYEEEGSTTEETDSGLVAYYAFDESSGSVTADSEGDYDGEVYGANFIDGKIGNALEFDGADDYVKISNLPGTWSQKTVMFWVKRYSEKDASIMIRSGTDFYITDDSSGITYPDAIRHGDLSVGRTEYNFTWDDSWHHFAWVFDGTKSVVYIDGSQKGSCDVTGTISTSGDVEIAKPQGGFTQYFNGAIDELYIYNRALTAEEISANI